MAEHYTKNTVSVKAWCPKCYAFTMHRVDGGRKGPCEVCLAKPVEPAKVKPEDTQAKLFG